MGQKLWHRERIWALVTERFPTGILTKQVHKIIHSFFCFPIRHGSLKARKSHLFPFVFLSLAMRRCSVSAHFISDWWTDWVKLKFKIQGVLEQPQNSHDCLISARGRKSNDLQSSDVGQADKVGQRDGHNLQQMT